MVNRKGKAGNDTGGERKSNDRAGCIDCLFRYRCKLGLIDCELKTW